MDARASLGEKTAQEAPRPRGLHDLDRAAALEAIRAPGEDVRTLAGIRLTAQLAAEKRRGVGDAGQRDGDVVEEDAVDEAQPVKTSRAASSARSMPRALTSRWVTARIVRGPRAPMRMP